MANFQNWFQTFIEEKNIDLEHTFEFEDENGYNMMPVGVVVEAIMGCSESEQVQIKNNFVAIDFVNGDVYHFLNHLAKGLAANS